MFLTIALCGGLYYFLSKPPLSDYVIKTKVESQNSSKDIHQGDHARQIKNIDEAWEYIELGNQGMLAGDYNGAVAYYDKAYGLDKGSAAVSGFHLAEAYEKLNRYVDAIAILDDMIVNNRLSKLGTQDANELKARLLTAKAQAAQNAQSQTP